MGWAQLASAGKSMMGNSGGGGGMGSFLQSQGAGARIGGLTNGIFNMFFAKNPSDAANPYLDQMGGKAAQYMQPFVDKGAHAGNIWGAQNENNVNNPTAIMDKIGAGYQESPGYKYNVAAAMRGANMSAAAGGMAGTPAEQQHAQMVASGLASQDYDKYMDRGLGQYTAGMGGLSHQNDLGFMGSQQMVQALMEQLKAQAQNAYEGANTSNQQKGGAIGSITGAFT